MKKLAFIKTSRAVSAPVTGSALRRPMRLWMTGSLAVVMAAFAPMRGALDSVAQNGHRLVRHSRYGVDETAQRIEAAARGRGLSVLARMSGQRPVIVLASSVGGTLVVMDESNSLIEIPLSVNLSASATAGGGVEVSIIAALSRFDASLRELPSAVADDLAALPEVLDRALA